MPDRSLERGAADAGRDAALALNEELERTQRLLGQMEDTLRLIDPVRFLAQLDTRLADVSEQVKVLQETNRRVRDLATEVENERLNAPVPATRATVIWAAAMVILVQVAVIIAIQVK